ncbi:MAG: hypothetical protein RR802_05965 [Erysipelotrichaceae bacterium]
METSAYIVERGNNANGNWIKYADGRCEIFLNCNTTTGFTEPYGSLIAMKEMISIPLPFALAKCFYKNSSVVFGGISFSGSVNITTNNNAQCWCMNPIQTSTGSYQITVMFYIVGTWK